MIHPTTNPDLATGSSAMSPSPQGSDSSGPGFSTGASRGHAGGTNARYGEQARQYGDRLRTRMNDRPLRSVGIVLAAGVLLDRLFLRKPKVRVVKVPDRTRPTGEPSPLIERRIQRWSDAADAQMQRVRRAGQASDLPLQMRLATQRLMARSQEYGSMARSTVEAHPWAGLGAVLAASGLMTAVLMRRRAPAPGTYGIVDGRARGGPSA